MAQQVTTGLPGIPTTTTTVYVGNIAEVATFASTSTTTTYYYAGQLRIAEAVNGPTSGTVSYLCTDALGSTTVALSGSGTVTAAQLYGPYGAVRYSSGTMPTVKGFTGQRADASTSGLDYYGARYYDPALGQFASADTKQGPNRFAYVAGNPETLTDPTGHARWCGDGDCGGGGGGGGCHSDGSCGCYSSCGTPPPPPPGKNPPPPTPPVQKLSFGGTPQNWWDPGAWLQLAKATALMIGGLAAMFAAFASFEANPVVGLALFLNSIDAFIHAAATVASVVWGDGSGANKVLQSLAVVADFVATLADSAALATMGGGAAAGEIATEATTSLLQNTGALLQIQMLFGIDIVADISDFQDLAKTQQGG